jgi:hypothetical protein
MAINREWRCTFHECEFESSDNPPHCPYGCDPVLVVMEFRTPPSTRSTGTRHADAWQRQLAEDYGLTDMRGDKDGSSVMSNTRASSGGARQIGEQNKPYWDANRFPVKPGWVARNEETPVYKPPKDLACAATSESAMQQGARQHMQTATRFVTPKEGSKS